MSEKSFFGKFKDTTSGGRATAKVFFSDHKFSRHIHVRNCHVSFLKSEEKDVESELHRQT